ncbi:pleckstrin homology domain-containing family A member 4-like isoform X2 [Nyctibius grandis]|uniref:pleckstrin homology domain-containing family A member 4-like isoform X2 n=1 Tax=Nyctibius grandis TaxID=48427 RepID=UPI0035BBBB52
MNGASVPAGTMGTLTGPPAAPSWQTAPSPPAGPPPPPAPTAPAPSPILLPQDSSGLRLWKRRWFVLVDLCLYYYRDSSEQQVRGGLPLPGYEIRVLPPAPRTPRFLFTAEHPGMRTYCLGAETPEELNAWVCALRRGASPLPGSPSSVSLQESQEPRGAGPPSPPLPARAPGEELGGPPTPPPRHPPVPPLPPSKEEAPARAGPCGTEDTQARPRGPPVGAVAAAAAGRSPPKPRLPGAESNQRLPPLAGRGQDAAEQDIAANQTLASPPGSSDWLLASEGSDGALPSSGTASPPAANESSSWRGAGASGRGLERGGAAGRGGRRPIRITLLQASF